MSLRKLYRTNLFEGSNLHDNQRLLFHIVLLILLEINMFVTHAYFLLESFDY